MRIAACYIVKNEEQELRSSIESLRGAVDELVVVDTGSEDRTVEVAKSFDASVFFFPWQNDFALARNFALDHVESPWIIFLDADESFRHPEEVRPAILDALRRDPSLDALMIPLYNVDIDDGGKVHGCDFVLRILRNAPELRYGGRIHEMLQRSGAPLELGYADERLAVLHTGYSSSSNEKKAGRNLALLEADIAEHGKNPGHDLYLADCYFGMRDYRKALAHALQALDSDLRIVGMQGHPYHVAIECMRRLDMDPGDMLALAQAASRALPDLPEFYGEQGMVLSSMGRLEEAKAQLETALERHDELRGGKRRMEGSYFTDTARSIVLKRLGEIAQRMGDIPLALERFEQALRADDRNEGARTAFRAFLEEFPPEARGAGAPRICACYIARNEAGNLSRSMESLRGQADEFVVVDTGSEDDTLATAKRFGAVCYSFPWTEDFSAARNFALAHAVGDWIVFLDADEYFSPETAANLRAAIEVRGARGALLFCLRNIEQDGAVLLDFYAPRAFRNLPGIHYAGRIHEQLLLQDGSLPESVAVPKEEVMIIHTGYAKTLSKKKAERNRRLLEKELSRTEYPERLYMYLAEAYDGLDREEEAIFYAMKDISTGRKQVTYASRSYRILLRLLAGRPAAHEERLQIAARAAADFPELPEFHAEYAECLAEALDFGRAIPEAECALRLWKDYRGLEPMMFSAEQVALLERRLVLWPEICKRASELRISACLIARDEEKSISEWLENTAVFSDERIAVDTGSVDATPRLLQEAGCRVVSMEWQGDFAAARNRALEEARGDWAVVTDADETFLHPEKVRHFLAKVERTHPEADAIMVPIINVDADDGGREIQRFLYIRFLRLNPDLRYHGRVHERLERRGGEVKIHQEPYRMEIRHTGYSTGRIQAKIRRNLALLQEEIRSEGEKPQHFRYLADCYFGLGDYGKARRYAEMAIRGPRSVGSQSDMHYTVLRCMEKEHEGLEERLSFARAAAKEFPLLPDYHAFVGMLLQEMNRFGEAIPHLERAALLYERPKEQSGEATHFADMADEAYLALARACSHEGEKGKSDVALRKALQANPRNEEALDFWAEEHRKMPLSELAGKLTGICGTDASAMAFLSRWAERYGWIGLHLHIQGMLQENVRQGGNRTDLYEALRSGKDIRQELVAGLSRDIRRLPILLFRLEGCQGPAMRKLYETCRELLPPAMHRIWRVYEGGDPSGEPLSDGYSLILGAAVRYADDDQLLRFTKLAQFLSEGEAVQAARQLADGERWQAALAVDSMIPEGSECANGEFWLRTGKCLYQLGELDGAEECLRRALGMDGQLLEATAYLEWIGEEREHGTDFGMRHHKE